jgi:hypothetical protein
VGRVYQLDQNLVETVNDEWLPTGISLLPYCIIYLQADAFDFWTDVLKEISSSN